MFSRNSVDVIKGLRKGKVDRTAFLTTVFSEIKEEVKSTDLVVKTNAIKKLFVLALEGYDMEWAAFHVLEVMSSTKLSQKRMGFLAASNCFKSTSDILTLATNVFRREFVAANYLDTCVAVNCLCNIINSFMSTELLNDCVTLLNASKPDLRKKVCLLFFKIFFNNPDAVPQMFERVAEKLQDENVGVKVATVNTILEISRINPKCVLFTAKALFDLLTTTKNNWMIIKLLKTMVELTKVEPRLVKRLIDPLTTLLQSTPAKSVQYELIRTIISSFYDIEELVLLAMSKLQGFLDSNDPNLKYLGLSGLQEMIKKHPNLAEEYNHFIVEALHSKDLTIRLRALSLLRLTTSKQNLCDIIGEIVKEIQKSENSDIKEELFSTGLYLLSKENYDLVEDFKWMFMILGAFLKLKTSKYEGQLSSIMLDVVIRVEQLRPEAAELAIETLQDFESLKSEKCEALNALLFIIGEFGNTLSPENQENALELVLRDRWKILNFPESVHNALTAATFKLLVKINSINPSLKEEIQAKLEERSKQVDFMESQERSLLYINILSNLTDEEKAKLGSLITCLNPVPSYAQTMVFAPESLLVPIEIDENEIQTRNEDGTITYHYFRDEDFIPPDILSEEERTKRRNELKLKQKKDPFYLQTSENAQPAKKKGKGKKKLKKKPEESKEESKEEAKEETKQEISVPKPSTDKKYTVIKDPVLGNN